MTEKEFWNIKNPLLYGNTEMLKVSKKEKSMVINYRFDVFTIKGFKIKVVLN